MIKLEHVVLPSPEQMKIVIKGMRNPMNSWGMSDSYSGYDCNACGKIDKEGSCGKGDPEREHCHEYFGFELGPNDRSLMLHLSQAGTDHRKYMRMITVYLDITAPLYWWKEFDTYKVGTVANSCSTMHKIAAKKFTLEDFSHEHLVCISTLDYVVQELNCWRSRYIQYDEDPTVGENLKMSKKDIWWQMIQLLPSSYNQRRTVMLNYEVLANIYKSRRNHKLDEWHVFCNWIESLPYREIIWTTAGVKEV